MGWVDMMRYGAWPLSGQPPDQTSDRCYVSCSLIFVVLWLPLVVLFLAVNGVRLLQRQWGGCRGCRVWRGVAGVKGLTGVQGWRCWRGCGIGGVGGGAGGKRL